MAFEYGFYNSISGDRTYNATHFSKIFDGVINDGVFAGIGDKLFTTAGGGMTVKVGTGKAWFDHTWNLNTTIMPLTIGPSNPVLARYDTVVLEINDAQNIQGRINTIKIVSGTPSSNPVKPTLTNTQYIHQHPLAHIFVPASVTQITPENIEIVVGTSVCPFVTSILQTTDISGLFANWEYQFNVWFEHLKLYLNEDVVTNLQNQIDNCLKKTDVANWSQYINNVPSKVVPVNVVRQAIYNAKNTEAIIIKQSGTYTVPSGWNGDGIVIVAGGGGGGGGRKITNSDGMPAYVEGGGGGAGYISLLYYKFVGNTQISAIIGAGGTPGNQGGASSLVTSAGVGFDLPAPGGYAGGEPDGGGGSAGGGGRVGGGGDVYGGGGGGNSTGGNGGYYGGGGSGPNGNGTPGSEGGYPGQYKKRDSAPYYGWKGFINSRPFCNLVDGYTCAPGIALSSTLGGGGGFNGVGGNSGYSGAGAGGGGFYGAGGNGVFGAGGGGGFNGRGGDGGDSIYKGGGGGGGIDIGDGVKGGDGLKGGKGGIGYCAGGGGGGGGLAGDYLNYSVTGGSGAPGVAILICWGITT